MHCENKLPQKLLKKKSYHKNIKTQQLCTLKKLKQPKAKRQVEKKEKKKKNKNNYLVQIDGFGFRV